MPGPRIEPGTHWCKAREDIHYANLFSQICTNLENQFPFPRWKIGLIGHLPGHGGVISFNSIYISFKRNTACTQVQQKMCIKNITTFNRSPGRSPGKILENLWSFKLVWPPSLKFETFVTPPFLGVWNFLTHPFLHFKTLLTPTKFSSPTPRYLWKLPNCH